MSIIIDYDTEQIRDDERRWCITRGDYCWAITYHDQSLTRFFAPSYCSLLYVLGIIDPTHPLALLHKELS